MNFSLAREIYGVPWCVDAISFMQLNSILKNIQNGVELDGSEEKLNSISFFDFNSKSTLSKSEFDSNSNLGFNGIGIINLNGAITKNGGQSSYGTKHLSAQMLEMAKYKEVTSFIVVTDSGGGSSGAVKLMVDTINEVKKTKTVYGLVEKGGMAGSAAYGIISACSEVYSEDEMNIVGSVGTMIQFSGKPHGSIDSNGEKTIVLYATKSTEKNKAFNEAIDNDNYELLVNELLDPVNESFINMVLENRPQLKGSNYDNGHTVFSKDAIGTFIDGILSFEELVSKIELSSKLSINNNSNKKKMTKEGLQSEHASVYSEIVTEGVAKEKDRVQSWLAYVSADATAVIEGINSGLEITNAQAHQFQVKLATNGKLADLKQDLVIDEFSTTQTTTVDNGGLNDKQREIKAAFNF